MTKVFLIVLFVTAFVAGASNAALAQQSKVDASNAAQINRLVALTGNAFPKPGSIKDIKCEVNRP